MTHLSASMGYDTDAWRNKGSFHAEQRAHKAAIRSGFSALMFLILFTSAARQSRAAIYWLRLARLPSAKSARNKAALIQKDWTRGGRLLHVMVRAGRAASTSAAKKMDGHFFDILVGPFPSLPAAVNASYRFQREQPWLDQGWALDSVPVVISGAFVSAPVRFTSRLARACRALRAATDSKPQGENTGETNESNDRAARTMPWLAEALVARGFGYTAPRAYLPPLEQSSASFLAWDRLLVWGRREVCQKTPRLVGGPKPHVGPGPKNMTPQVHASGRRCLEWTAALTPDMKLAWFPAEQLAVSSRFAKATLTTRWGPVRIRYSLIRVGRSPHGTLYQAIFRSGGFPPVRKTIMIPDKYPTPHRLSFDRLGAAIFEGRGLIVRRISVQPPSPPIPVMWKMRRFKGYLQYEQELSTPHVHPGPAR